MPEIDHLLNLPRLWFMLTQMLSITLGMMDWKFCALIGSRASNSSAMNAVYSVCSFFNSSEVSGVSRIWGTSSLSKRHSLRRNWKLSNQPMHKIFQLIVPSVIDGICVNASPKSGEIKEIIDLRRIGPNRQTFYLAKLLFIPHSSP